MKTHREQFIMLKSLFEMQLQKYGSGTIHLSRQIYELTIETLDQGVKYFRS